MPMSLAVLPFQIRPRTRGAISSSEVLVDERSISQSTTLRILNECSRSRSLLPDHKRRADRRPAHQARSTSSGQCADVNHRLPGAAVRLTAETSRPPRCVASATARLDRLASGQTWSLKGRQRRRGGDQLRGRAPTSQHRGCSCGAGVGEDHRWPSAAVGQDIFTPQDEADAASAIDEPLSARRRSRAEHRGTASMRPRTPDDPEGATHAYTGAGVAGRGAFEAPVTRPSLSRLRWTSWRRATLDPEATTYRWVTSVEVRDDV